MSVRQFAHEVKHTLNGKLAIILLLFAVPAVPGLVRGSTAVAKTFSPQVNVGVLLIAFLFLLLAFALTISASLAKSLLTDREDEPLRVFTAALWPVAAYRLLVGTGLSAGTFLVAFYLVFHWGLLLQALPRPFIEVPVYVVSLVICLLVVGAGAATLFNSLIHRNDPRLTPTTVHRVGGMMVIVSMIGLPLVPRYVARRWPEAVAQVGALGEDLAWLHVPFAAARAAGQGSWAALLLWVVGLAGAVWVAGRVARSWVGAATLVVHAEPGSGKRRFAPIIRAAVSEPGRLRGVWLFWNKDVVAPFARGRSAYLAQQWVLLSGAMGVIISAGMLVKRQVIAPAQGSAYVLAVAAAVPLVLAMLRGLPCLGQEGSQIVLLRPVLSAQDLFLRKVVVNGAYVALHAAAYVLVVWVAAAAARSPAPPLPVLLGTALTTAAVATLAGCALGFLLPDMERRSVFLPGSAMGGKLVYSVTALYLLSIVGVAEWLRASEAVTVTTYLAMLGGTAVMALAATLAVAVWAVRRLPHLEL